MLGFDAQVDDLHADLVERINQANMPATVLDYLLTEILNDVRMAKISNIQEQRRKYAEEQGEQTAPIPPQAVAMEGPEPPMEGGGGDGPGPTAH